MDFLTRLATGALFVIIIATVTSSFDSAHSNNTPRVIELVGYNNRKARTHYKPEAQVATSSAKIQADIKTVKQNIEKYNKILSVDTKNLPKFQKDMLDRIVDRVARLKESLDINEKLTQVLNQTQFNKQREIEEMNLLENAENVENVTQLQLFTKNNTSTEKIDWLDKTDSSLLMDEQALLKLQTSLDKLSAVQEDVTTFQTKSHPRHLPITTEIIDFADTQQNDQKFTDITSDQAELFLYESTTSVPLELIDTTANDELFMVARSNNNNNNMAITAASPTFGNQPRPSSASSKITKMKATKRPPHSSTRFAQIPSIKRKPATVLSESTSNKSYSNYTTKTITKTVSSATQQQHQQPLEHYQKFTQQQQTQYPLPNLYTQLPEDADPILLPTSTINMDKYSAASVLSTPSIPLAPSSAALSSPAVNNVPAISSSLAAAVSTAPIIDFSKGTNSQNSQNLMYDGHFNTSAIIDSLNNAREEEFYHQKEASPTIASNNNDENPTTGGKPTKYHYYPHNQHIYLLPECAIQQVCNAVYVRLNYTQPLCACPSRYRDPCSASLNEDDHHTTKLVGDSKKKAITLAKTCEATTEMRECRSPKDWSLLALQNTRTGKSHYLVICRCPEHFKMDGPLAHDQNTYASVPGIRVYGMMCVKPGYPVRKASAQPPKRYQLQKPAYRPGSQINSMQYGRPSSSGLLNSPPHQSQSHSQSTYQYLNRPESTINTSFQNNYHRPDTISINNYPGATYGRHSEREDNSFIEALLEKNDEKVNISSSTQRVLMEEEERSAILNDQQIQAHTHTRESNNREKRSLMKHIITWPRHLGVAQILGFPWQRVHEFERSLN